MRRRPVFILLLWRLLGGAWLGGHEPASLAAMFYGVVYGHALNPSQLDAVLDGVGSIQP